jgi:periplasmic divalent cation tolerance protein
VLSPATSFYCWEGKDEQASEYPVLLKTTRARYPALEQAIRDRHPYDVPEIIAWEVSTGLPAYLEWVQREVSG